jgi:hypothetical protein
VERFYQTELSNVLDKNVVFDDKYATLNTTYHTQEFRSNSTLINARVSHRCEYDDNMFREDDEHVKRVAEVEEYIC